HPMSRVEHLPEEALLRLLEEVRSFAMLFYRCRRARRRVAPHFLVYNRRLCLRCGGGIRRERQGVRGRVSHFCPNCQRRF
ncbi:MAG: hypothetical protein GXO66_06940, partial [Euryarchaeota archaeon]|nr:hypothetical protein [Euryarchaeota archaeon]